MKLQALGEKNVVKFLDKLQIRKTFLTANENPEAIEDK